jgi:DegV family protein with EDD domain
MNKFEIFCDSAANLTDEMINQNNINVVSYTCSIDGQEMECYQKGVDNNQTAKKFYDAMRAGSETKTTLLNSQKIIDAVSPTLAAGKDIIFVTISSGLSGTYHQAVLAAEELAVQFPDRKFVPVDPMNAGMGEGLVVLNIAKLRDMGQSIEACAEWVKINRLNIHAIFTVNDLKYLRRGGRISATLAIAGTLLNIKPILKADANGKIASVGKERGRKKALATVTQMFAENVIGAENQKICIAHADCEEDAIMLADMIKAYGAKDIEINMYDVCTGSHVGPGTIALFFVGKERAKVSEVKEANPIGIPVKANK